MLCRCRRLEEMNASGETSDASTQHRSMCSNHFLSEGRTLSHIKHSNGTCTSDACTVMVTGCRWADTVCRSVMPPTAVRASDACTHLGRVRRSRVDTDIITSSETMPRRLQGAHASSCHACSFELPPASVAMSLCTLLRRLSTFLVSCRDVKLMLLDCCILLSLVCSAAHLLTPVLQCKHAMACLCFSRVCRLHA